MSETTLPHVHTVKYLHPGGATDIRFQWKPHPVAPCDVLLSYSLGDEPELTYGRYCRETMAVVCEGKFIAIKSTVAEAMMLIEDRVADAVLPHGISRA